MGVSTRSGWICRAQTQKRLKNSKTGHFFFFFNKLDLEREIRAPNCAASRARAHLLSMHLFYRRHFLGEPGETKHQSEEDKRGRLTALRRGDLNISNTHHRQLQLLKRGAFEVEQQTPLLHSVDRCRREFCLCRGVPTTKSRGKKVT